MAGSVMARGLDRRVFSRRATLGLALACPALLAACASGPGTPASFPKLRYSYLPPITLKVSSIDIKDEYVPGPDAAALIMDAPEAPASALRAMAQDRLVGDGSPGSAVFIVKTASLHRKGGTISGHFEVELNVRATDGKRVGYADASVSRTEPVPQDADPATVKAALYELTRKLMFDMNVEFQYQVQKSLGEWLAFKPGQAAPAGGSGASSGAGGIQATPLGGSAPGGARPATSGAGASAGSSKQGL